MSRPNHQAQELDRLASALRSAAFAEGISCEKALNNFGNDAAHAADRAKALAADEAHAALLAAIRAALGIPPSGSQTNGGGVAVGAPTHFQLLEFPALGGEGQRQEVGRG